MRPLEWFSHESSGNRGRRSTPSSVHGGVIHASGCGNTGTAPLIVHVIYRLGIGGLENGLVNLINRTPAGHYRHAIICLTETTDFQRRLKSSDVPIFALHKRPGKDLANYVKLWSLLRELRPAIVHTRNLGTIDVVLPAVLAGVRHRVHGEHGWDQLDLHGSPRKYALLRRCCSPLISRQIAVSRHIEAWLKSQIGVPERKLVHIHNGVDSTRFHPAVKRESLAPPGFASPDCVVIGSVGRMQRVKDPLVLVRAFLDLVTRLPAQAQRLRLIMIGDGPLRAEALSLIERAGLGDIAWLPGSRDDVPDVLRNLNIFVLPSLNEGMSNTILEAMATGLPIVATRVGGNPEVVRDGRWGTLVPPSNPQALSQALQMYVNTPEARRDHGLAGRRQVEQYFSLEAMVSSYLKLYDEVLGRTPMVAATQSSR